MTNPKSDANTALSLIVGETYRSIMGEPVKIVGIHETVDKGKIHYLGDNGNFYHENGTPVIAEEVDDQKIDPSILIEKIVEEPYNAELQLAVGQVYATRWNDLVRIVYSNENRNKAFFEDDVFTGHNRLKYTTQGKGIPTEGNFTPLNLVRSATKEEVANWSDDPDQIEKSPMTIQDHLSAIYDLVRDMERSQGVHIAEISGKGFLLSRT